ncbi:hypothetical protein E0Z10_g4104 [Xylaria hypoxylon]|uniref:Arylsulfotransferase N-terminal domain-containing protein n=1 Tax=Xylaria hypoxylon TaxID=37992 RepID=A0A4Z0Z567_9PEZI|nr:hypothetical protein E0Z10_g4104 [Xylaria hypoxylon]
MTRILPWLLLLTAITLDARVWAFDVFTSSYLYELGFYGSQKGKLVSDPGPTIFDSRGELVWTDDSYGAVFNFQIQTYKGENYLTFWSNPEGSTHGYGRGTYYILDSSYQLFGKFEPAGEGLQGDLHEFQITEHGTTLMTIYNPVPADLTSIGGPEQGWALDCLFQEIDIATGELLFEWSAIEHVALSDTVRYFAGEDDGTTPETAYDFFHINSVDVDGEGNYVVSGRHTSSILCISPQGKILWTLGGISNEFLDLSDGHATDFMYQHHAKLHGGHTLSIFDNAASERAGQASKQGHSRGILVQLDTTNMTATLLHEYFDPGNPRTTSSQGSMQVMDDRVVLGYGWLPFITEFALDGSVLCAVELAPWVAARWGLVNTYRAFKAPNWVGRPTDTPSVYVDPSDSQVFVSWNGATEVERWVLQGAEWTDLKSRTEGKEEETKFRDLDVVDKDSFETAFGLLDDMPQYIRVAAVDKHGNVLTHSQIVDRRVGNAPKNWLYDALVCGAVFAALIAAVLLVIGRRGRKAILGNFSRGYDALGRTAVAWRSRMPRAEGMHEPCLAKTWWKDWGSAKPHELQSIYHEYT